MTWIKLAKKKPTDVPMWGTLKRNGTYYYLSVDSRLFLPFIAMIGDVQHPKEVTKPENDVGAHITVFKAKEGDGLDVTELGKQYSFTLCGLESVKPDGWEEVNKVYFITVDSPDLEKLRKKYGLSAKIEGHDFHITVAVEPA